MKHKFQSPSHHTLRCIISSVVLAAFTFYNAHAQELNLRIDSVVHHYLDKGLIPGAVVQIKQSGQILFSKAFGYAQTHQGKGERLQVPRKLTHGHLFDIASLTKVVGTTTAMMLLVDRGQVKLEDPVSKYISGFSVPSKSSITIKQLLQHTSGMYEWYPMYYRASDRQEVYELINALPIPYPVGTKRRYSDLGFTVLGEIIEKVSGLPLELFLEQQIFHPLSMHHTVYLPNQKNKRFEIAATSTGNPFERRMVYDPALGYQFSEVKPDSWNSWRDYVLVGEVNDGNAWYAGKGVSGAAGLFSTAHDLQKLVDMLLAGGKAGHKTFLSSQVIQTFLTKDEFDNGLGWMMDSASSFMNGVPAGSYGHTGFTGTSIVVVPEKQLSVIILINRQHTGLIDGKNYFNVNPLRQSILDLCLKSTR